MLYKDRLLKYNTSGSSLTNLFNDRINDLILSGRVKVFKSLDEFKNREK